MRKATFLTLLICTVLTVGCDMSTTSGTTISSQPGDSEYQWEIPEDSWTYSNRIMYVRNAGFVTGEDAAVDTTAWGVGGTDLGLTFFDPEINRFYAAFGDTFATAPMRGRWNSNAILYTDHLDYTDGIQWEGILPGQHGTTSTVTPITRGVANSNGTLPTLDELSSEDTGTCIPTGAVVVDGDYYLFYMEVLAFYDTGEFDVFSNSVVKSTDKGQTWTRVDTLRWQAIHDDRSQGDAPGFAQIHPLLAADGYVYIYGIPGGRSGGVQLGRVPAAEIEDFEAYEYYHLNRDDTIDWRSGSNGLRSIKGDEASYIVAPSCGELSITWNGYLNRYIMTYMQNNSQIVIRRSSEPWGTWSSSDSLVTQSDINQLYGGFSHEMLSDHDGRRIYLLVSQWTPVYNVHLVEVVFA